MSLTETALPSSWQWVPLKHLTTVLRRGTTPSYADDGPIHAISQASNQLSGLDWERTRFHDYAGDPQKLKGHLNPGDTMINSTGRGTLGRVGYFNGSPDDKSCMADTHVTLARADTSQWDPRFAYYYLSSDLFYGYVYSALVVGATNQIELSNERLSAAPAVVPPLDEQRRIADFLDGECGQISSLVAARQQQRELLNERLRSYSSFTAMSDVPLEMHGGNEWRDIRAKYLYRVVDVRAGEVDLPLLTVSIHKGVVPRSEMTDDLPRAEDLSNYKLCERGDIVLNRMRAFQGGIGISSVSGIVSPDYLVLRLNEDLEGRFFHHLFRSTWFVGEMISRLRGIGSVAQGNVRTPRINAEDLGDIRINLPSADQQRHIADALDTETEKNGRLLGALHRQLTLLSERRQALITAAVTGQIDVTTARGV